MSIQERAIYILAHRGELVSTSQLIEIIDGLMREVSEAYQEGYLAGCKFTDAELNVERHMP